MNECETYMLTFTLSMMGRIQWMMNACKVNVTIHKPQALNLLDVMKMMNG